MSGISPPSVFLEGIFKPAPAAGRFAATRVSALTWEKGEVGESLGGLGLQEGCTPTWQSAPGPAVTCSLEKKKIIVIICFCLFGKEMKPSRFLLKKKKQCFFFPLFLYDL